MRGAGGGGPPGGPRGQAVMGETRGVSAELGALIGQRAHMGEAMLGGLLRVFRGGGKVGGRSEIHRGRADITMQALVTGSQWGGPNRAAESTCTNKEGRHCAFL